MDIGVQDSTLLAVEALFLTVYRLGGVMGGSAAVQGYMPFVAPNDYDFYLRSEEKDKDKDREAAYASPNIIPPNGTYVFVLSTTPRFFFAFFFPLLYFKTVNFSCMGVWWRGWH